MVGSWEDIEKAAARGTLVVKQYYIGIPFEDGNLCVIIGMAFHDHTLIRDIFTGRGRRASYEECVEYVQRLHLLPTPTPISDQLAARVDEDVGKRVGPYMRLTGLGGNHYYSYVCNEYLFMCIRDFFEIFTLGQMVTIGSSRLLYSAETVIDGAVRGLFKI
jgi:hypothetical protein